MHKLSGMDATFLYMETNETPMHISSLLVCEPAQEGESPYEALKAQIVSRLHEIPSFHRKLKHTPFYIDHPVWVEAEIVDLDYHIKHARLPNPGDLEQLRMIVQGLHSNHLDRDRPLWQFYIIEGVEDPAFGLEEGSFALYTKAHHACLDGGAGISVMDILSDLKPTPRPPLPNSEVKMFAEHTGFFDLLGSAFGRFVQLQSELVKNTPALINTVRNIVTNTMENDKSIVDDFRPAPNTRFNVRIQKQRAFGALTLPLQEVIAVAKKTDTKLNDVVLAICGGALRSYLLRHEELPEKSLVAAVPVSIRELGDTSGANQVASMNCGVGTDVENVLDRLHTVNNNSKHAKKNLAAIRDVFPTDYSFFGAPLLVTAFAQLTSRTNVMNYLPSPFNVTISNVPGSRKPMYFAGSRVRSNLPVSIATHGCALNITLTSYVDRLDFGLIACKVAVPDVQDIADDISAEFQKLQAAVFSESGAGTPQVTVQPIKSA